MCDLSVNIYKAFNNKLKRIIHHNRVDQMCLLHHILKQSVVPDEAFKWLTESTRSSVELISCLIKERLCLDKKIQNVISALDEWDRQYMSCDSVDLLLKDNNIDLSLYEKVFLFSLLTGDTDMEDICSNYKDSFPIKNISLNYDSTVNLLDDAFCKAARLADHKLLKNIVKAAGVHNLCCEIDPDTDLEHKKVIDWLNENVIKGIQGENRLGWKEGPDSAKWPSTKLHDYIKTLDCLYENMSR